MRLLQRLTNIVSANVSDLVDHLEDPERMLRQSIRDMESTVDVAFHSAAGVIAAGHLLERQIASRQVEIERITARAQRAAQTGNDSLARSCLMQRREQQTILQALTSQLATTHDAECRLRKRLETLRHRLDDAKCQLQTLVARQRSAVAHRRLLTDLGTTTVSDPGIARFEHFREQVNRSEAELEALRELAGDEDWDDAERSQEIEKELLDLKAAQTD